MVTSDSRRVGPGAVFVAIAGGQSDGHRYLREAWARGAVAAVGTEPVARLRFDGSLPDGLPYVCTTNSRLALAGIGALLHGYPSRSLVTIGVTGTDGKTTTCSLVEAILAAATRTQDFPHGRVGVVTTVGARICGLASDTGLHVTTPDAPDVQRYLAAMRDAGCRYAVVESTSHGLDQERVAAVDFDIAAVTNITHEHLDYHGNRDAYVAAKAKLFRALFAATPKPGIPRAAVLNADDAGSFAALRRVLAEEAAASGRAVPSLCYGVQGASSDPGDYPSAAVDVAAAKVDYRADGTRFDVHWREGAFELQTPLIGDFNVQNVLCAAAIALALGVSAEVIQAAVAGFAGVSGRMERIDEGQPFLALVDFAHSPASLERALITLRGLRATGTTAGAGRIIAVFGCAGLRDVAKRRLMGAVSGRLSDFTVITAEDPRTEDLAEISAEIAAGLLEHAGAGAFAVIPDRTEAINYAVRLAQAGDIVAAFGKGHERSICFGDTEVPWNEQEVMRAALRRRATTDA